LVLAVDQYQLALPAHHLVHRADGDDAAGGVEGGVGGQQDPVTGDRQLGAVIDQQCSREAAEELVGDVAVVVWVIPVGAGRVVSRNAVGVVERRTGSDADERVVPVALRGDV
jgi:hypothetical protein